jgi:branched-chain amino acid transport system permease protein
MVGFFQLMILGVMEGGLYALIGSAIVLVYKSTEVASLAHGQFLAFGAIFFYLFSGLFGLPFLISLILTFLTSGLLGLAVERLTLRPLIGQPLFTAFLITFAIFTVFDGVFNIILQGEMIGFPAFLPRTHIQVSGLSIPTEQLASFLTTLILFGLLWFLFKFTKLGLGMLATAENHQLAQSVGISVKRVFSFVWALSAIVAAVAGIATANVMDIYYPLPYLGVKGLIVALFGGLDSLPGALIGGILLGILENVAAGYLDPAVGGGVKEVAAYVMLLIILFIRPYGLMGSPRIERI